MGLINWRTCQFQWHKRPDIIRLHVFIKFWHKVLPTWYIEGNHIMQSRNQLIINLQGSRVKMKIQYIIFSISNLYFFLKQFYFLLFYHLSKDFRRKMFWYKAIKFSTYLYMVGSYTTNNKWKLKILANYANKSTDFKWKLMKNIGRKFLCDLILFFENRSLGILCSVSMSVYRYF